MRRQLAKLTSKNQLTLPQWAIEELDYPSHFEIIVRENVLLLFPSRIVSLELLGKRSGLPLDVLRLAQKILADRKAEAQAQSGPETIKSAP